MWQCTTHNLITQKKLHIRWHNIVVRWDENKSATLWIDNKKRHSIRCNNRTLHGVSYLHLLGGRTPDSTGVLIEKIYGKSL